MCLYSDALEKKLQLETQPALQDYFTSQPFLYVFIILSKNQSEWTFDFLISPFLGRAASPFFRDNMQHCHRLQRF